MKTSFVLVGAVAICVSLGGCQTTPVNSANLYNYDYDGNKVNYPLDIVSCSLYAYASSGSSGSVFIT
ncbi:MAG: hypothetical protein Q8L68_00360, partial [Methylococcales bacterium]|nr:hypothetical protein [Methylococcales bacterium]